MSYHFSSEWIEGAINHFREILIRIGKSLSQRFLFKLLIDKYKDSIRRPSINYVTVKGGGGQRFVTSLNVLG